MRRPPAGFCHGFGRSVVFAALAAIGYPVWSLLADPILGAGFALAFYLVSVTALYVAGASPRLGRGLLAGAFAGFLGLMLLVLATRTGQVAVGCALIVGLFRGAWLLPSRPARALLVEPALLLGGLLLAHFLMTPGPLGAAFALWGFLLVQSLYFLIPGAQRSRSEASALDPFEQARARALALLDEG